MADVAARFESNTTAQAVLAAGGLLCPEGALRLRCP